MVAALVPERTRAPGIDSKKHSMRTFLRMVEENNKQKKCRDAHLADWCVSIRAMYLSFFFLHAPDRPAFPIQHREFKDHLGLLAIRRYVPCLITRMMTVFILAGIYVSGFALMALGMRDAPEGYEDEQGFHWIWRNNSADAADICCVWAVLGSPSHLSH
jgi:hypothetical protein